MTMADTRKLTANGRPLTNRKEPAKYKVSVPTMKQAVSERLFAVEQAAARPEPRASRCCGRCKTPFNCGNKACPCHTIRYTP